MLIYTIKRSMLILVEVIELAILARVLISFLGNLRNNRIADFIFQITEPILYPCRTLLEKFGLGNGMLDFSPILAYFILRFIVMIVYRIL